MARRDERAGGFGLVGTALLGMIGIGSLGVTFGMQSVRTSDPTPAEVVALRFLPGDSTMPAPARQLATFTTASLSTHEEPGLFNPNPSYPMTPEAAAPDNPPTPEPAVVTDVQTVPAKAAMPNTPAPASRRVVVKRPNGVLNDAQIASIKARLNLTPQQERMWPAVEAALREISYTRGPAGRPAQSGAVPAAQVDPNSAEAANLKAAAIPLIANLNDQQRQEVKLMAHVMGLGSLVAEF